MNARASILLTFLALAAGAAEFRATWNIPTNTAGIVAYQVSIGTNQGSSTLTNSVGITNSIVISNLTSGITYWLRARSMGSNGVPSDWTPEVQQFIPPAPSGLGATNAGILIVPQSSPYPIGQWVDMPGQRILIPLSFGGPQGFYRVQMAVTK